MLGNDCQGQVIVRFHLWSFLYSSPCCQNLQDYPCLILAFPKVYHVGARLAVLNGPFLPDFPRCWCALFKGVAPLPQHEKVREMNDGVANRFHTVRPSR